MAVQIDTSTIAADVPVCKSSSWAGDASPRYPVHLAVWVFAAFQFFYMLTSSGRVRTADEYNTLYTTQSIVLRGSTAVPQAVQLRNFYGRFDRYGQPQAAYPPGQAIAAAPWFAVGQFILARLPGVPRSALDFVVGFSSSLSSATFSALAVALFLQITLSVGVAPPAALLATVLMGLATSIFGYSAWFFSEPLSAASFLAVALILFRRPGVPIALGSAVGAGLILGFATWVRPTNVLAIAIFAVAIILRDGKRALHAVATFCAAAALGVVTLLVRDVRLFGNPFDFGYPSSAGGVHIENSFDTPLLTGLYGLLLSPGKSVILFAPPAIVAVAGLRRLWRMERGVAAIAILFPLVYLFFFVRYAHWEGGYCVGPRYLVPAIPMLCLGLGPVLASKSARAKTAAIACIALGILVQGISLATSFLEDQAPSRGRYYDSHWVYRLDYSLSGQAQLLWKYLIHGQPPTLGLGWDRWFVFLHKGGVSGVTLGCIVGLMLAGLGISILGLTKTLRSTSQIV